MQFRRKVHQVTAHISLGDQFYCLGRKRMRSHQLTYVQVRMDPEAHQWVVLTDDLQEELIRLAPKKLDVFTLTGLESPPISLQQPVQLLLPFWINS